MNNRRTITIKQDIQHWIFQYRGYQLRKFPHGPDLDHTKAINVLLSEAIQHRQKEPTSQFDNREVLPIDLKSACEVNNVKQKVGSVE